MQPAKTLITAGAAVLALALGSLPPAAASPPGGRHDLGTPDQTEYAGYSVPIADAGDARITGSFIAPKLGSCDGEDRGAFTGFEMIESVDSWVKSGLYSFCLNGKPRHVAGFEATGGTQSWFWVFDVADGDHIKVTIKENDEGVRALVRHRERHWYSFDDYPGFEMTDAVAVYLPITIDDVRVPVLAPRSARISQVKVNDLKLELADPTMHVLHQDGNPLVAPSEITDQADFKYKAVGGRRSR